MKLKPIQERILRPKEAFLCLFKSLKINLNLPLLFGDIWPFLCIFSMSSCQRNIRLMKLKQC